MLAKKSPAKCEGRFGLMLASIVADDFQGCNVPAFSVAEKYYYPSPH
jgi:hypothetical protein